MYLNGYGSRDTYILCNKMICEGFVCINEGFNFHIMFLGAVDSFGANIFCSFRMPY